METVNVNGQIVDLDPLTTAQRVAVALDLIPTLIQEKVENERRGPGRPLSESGKTAAIAAAMVGIGRTSVETGVAIQKRDPAIIERMRTGEMNVAQAARAVGLTGRGGRFATGLVNAERDASGREPPRIYFGKGDKWKEAVAPLLRYLAAWERRGFEYRHVNPKEARRRVTLISELQEKLDAARQDLEQRAHSASLSISKK